MFGLKNLVNFASASGDGKIDIFTPQVSLLMHVQNFIWKLRVLQKIEIILVG